MLPAVSRLRKSHHFAKATAKGNRYSTINLVAYLVPEFGESTKVGFIVNKSIGGSVTRHKILRQLRHLVRNNLDNLPKDSLVVIRVLRPLNDYQSEIVELLQKINGAKINSQKQFAAK